MLSMEVVFFLFIVTSLSANPISSKADTGFFVFTLSKERSMKVYFSLKKASKPHAAQAKTLQGVLKNATRNSNSKTK